LERQQDAAHGKHMRCHQGRHLVITSPKRKAITCSKIRMLGIRNSQVGGKVGKKNYRKLGIRIYAGISGTAVYDLY